MSSSKARQILFGLAVSLAAVGAVVAAPVINAVITGYSDTGTPTSITINGTGLCSGYGTTCGSTPTVKLGGSNGTTVTVTAHTKTSVTASLPQPFTVGGYELYFNTCTACRDVRVHDGVG